MKTFNAIATIAYRDVAKFSRDRSRIVAAFIFPIIFIAVLGGSFEKNLGSEVGFNFLTFIFTGIIAQTLFQSTASGIISLIEDRENDFAQELFIAPLSRYTIIIGKIVGESLVSFIQVTGVVMFSILFGVPIDFDKIILLIPVGILIAFLGGAFGVIVVSQLNSQRAANQIFPFVMLPQFFLAGVFSPVTNLPWYLWILSRISPMTYAVDLTRSVYYLGNPVYDKVVIFNPFFNFTIISGLIIVMLIVGTFLFIRNERNR